TTTGATSASWPRTTRSSRSTSWSTRSPPEQARPAIHRPRMPMNAPLTESDIQARVARLADLRAAIASAIVGQHDVVEQLLTGLLAGGHCLLEGVPGLGKTLLVRTLGQALELQFRRVQFTPDLMPSD